MGWQDWLEDVGETVSDVVETVAPAVGEVTAGHLDVNAWVLDKIGFDGTAQLLDGAADWVRDTTGAVEPELELGETDDPTQLVHGDVEQISGTARHLRAFANGFHAAGRGLRKIDTGPFRGEAAMAYDETATKQPGEWAEAGDACGAASAAWARFGLVLARAQGMAEDAIRLYDEGTAATERAVSAYDAKVAAYNANVERYNRSLTGGQPWGRRPTAPGEFVDPGAEKVAQARAKLARARRQRGEAAERARNAIVAATANAPQEPSVGDQLRLGAVDLWNVGNVEGAHFTFGLLKGATGLLAFLRSTNLADFYNLTHPAEWVQGISHLLAGLTQAPAHPGPTVESFFTGFSDDPGEWFGRASFDALLTALTDGAGLAARSATLRRLEGLVDDGPRVRESAIPDGIKQCASDPVDVATGTVLMPETDVELPGALPLVVQRCHASSWRYGRWFGETWSSTLDEQLVVLADAVVLQRGDGVLLVYPHPSVDEPSLPREGERWPLERLETGAYRITEPETGRRRHYAGAGSFVPLLALSTPGGDRVTFHRDEYGAPVEVRHSGGYRVLVDTEDDRVMGLSVTRGDEEPTRVTTYAHDEAGHLAEVVNSSGRPMRYSYDDHGRLTSWVDRNDTTYYYSYDDHGRCISQAGTANALAWTFEYLPDPEGADGRVTLATDSLGATTAYHVNARSQVERIVDPLGRVTRRVWDRFDRLLAQTDPAGRVTRFGYDDAGNPTEVVRPDGSTQQVSYAAPGRPHEVVGFDGSRWRQEYDVRGLRTAVVDPLGATTELEYDDHGHLVAVTDALGGVTRVVNDPAGLPVSLTRPDGSTVSLERDVFGRVIAEVGPSGERTETSWTPEGRPATRTLPDGAVETWEWDGEGNLVGHVGAAGDETRYTYGAFDLVESVAAPDGTLTGYRHDSELRLVAVTNGAGQEWSYRYDAAGQLVGETDFDGRTLGYAYDEAGQLARRVNGAGESLSFTYDDLGRLVSQGSPSGESVFSYDPLGRLVRATNSSADVVLERDAVGRVVSESVDGRAVRSSYDLLGRRTSRTTPAGVVSEWSHDALGLVSGLTVAGRPVTFARDASGREIRREWGVGVALGQAYDDAGRLVEQSVTLPSLAAPSPAVGHDLRRDLQRAAQDRALQRRRYAYRPDGVLVGIDDALRGRATMELDPVGRVTTVSSPASVERFGYDAAGNLAGDGRSLSGTRLLRAGGTRFRYDAQGRLVERVKTRLSRKREVWRYTWDAEDRLVGLTTPDGARWRYRYDAFGRRVGKELVSSSGSVESRTDFTWDGTTLVEESSTAGVLTWEYDGQRPLAQIASSSQPTDDPDSTFYAIVTDLVGAPTELVTEDGELAWQSRRSLWGAGPLDDPIPLGFPGQYRDPESGLSYNHFRYYDPLHARYVSPDPLGLAGGPNPAAYVPNPTGWVDPLGLSPGCCHVNVLSPAERQHILNGDGPGSGGHQWPGAPGKSPYPQSWTADQILHNVGDIVTDPDTKWYAQTGNGGLRTKDESPAVWRAWEVRDGERIRVAWEPATGHVRTAFPDNGPVKGIPVN